MKLSNYLLTLSLALCGSIIDAKKRKRSCQGTCSPTPISHSTTITESGSYCVTRDIRGTIIIAADNVTLDLNSHVIDGNGCPFAIDIAHQHDVTIKNGAVTNDGSLCIRAVKCTGLTIDTIQAYNTEGALHMVHCSSSRISNIRAFNNLSTYTALIFFDDLCDSIEVTDVTVTHNTKVATANTNEFTPGTAFVCVNNSTNINFTRVYVNTNTFNNYIPIADQINHWRTASAIAFFSSYNCTLTDCSTSNNTDIAGNVATLDTEDYFLCLLDCSSCVVTGHASNGNECLSTILYFISIAALDSTRIVFNQSTANDMIVAALFAGEIFSEAFGIGIWAADYFILGASDDIVISHCQVSGNVIVDAAAPGSLPGVEGDLVGIAVVGANARCTIEYCQVNDNSILSAGDNQFVDGIEFTGQGATIAHCSCNDNSGGQGVEGFLLEATVVFPASNVVITDCSSNNNSGRDFGVGFYVGGAFGNIGHNCAIINSQANGNTGSANGVGIMIVQEEGGSIINCQTDNNSHVGVWAGTYNDVYNPPPVINTHCSIIGCSAKNNGANGFELSNTSINDNFLIQDCIAIANAHTGFLHSNKPLTSRYLGNYAKANGTNYAIHGGAIQIFTLDAEGNYVNTSGDPVHFSSLANVEGR